MAICALLAPCWLAVRSIAAIIILACFYGVTSGDFVSLLPPAVTETASSMDRFGTRMGMINACSSFGVLAGNSVAGATLMNCHSYEGNQLLLVLWWSCLLCSLQESNS